MLVKLRKKVIFIHFIMYIHNFNKIIKGNKWTNDFSIPSCIDSEIGY